MLNFVKIKQTRVERTFSGPFKFNGNVHTSVKVIFSTVIINPQEGGIYKCHKSSRQATTGHARMQPAWGREITRRNHFLWWSFSPIKDNNELMTGQDFLPQRKWYSKKWNKSCDWISTFVEPTIFFANCAQLLSILIMCGLKFKIQVAPYLVFFI